LITAFKKKSQKKIPEKFEIFEKIMVQILVQKKRDLLLVFL